MPLSSIVVIVIRLFALNWLLTSASLLLSAGQNPWTYGFLPHVPGIGLLVFTAALWFLAGAIARVVSQGVDTSISMGSLLRSDLYSFAFVFLGLFSSCPHSPTSSIGFTILLQSPMRTPDMTRVFGAFISLLGLA